MNADFIHHRCVVSPRGGQRTTRHLLLISTALCLLVPVTTGCQTSNPHQVAVEPHYGQLEQVCFGYEPTVWRTMPGQCEQAVRLIPEEVVHVPAATPAQATTESAPPAEAGAGPLGLEGVPEPREGLPGIIRGFTPESTTPEGTATPEAAPAEIPAPVQPQVQPPVENTPIENTPIERAPLRESTPEVPKVEVSPQVTPPVSPATAPKLSRREARKPATTVAQRPSEPATNAVASELFRSVEQALVVKPSDAKVAEQRPANTNSAIGLARFISY